MKLTKQKLKQIIKEELETVIQEARPWWKGKKRAPADKVRDWLVDARNNIRKATQFCSEHNDLDALCVKGTLEEMDAELTNTIKNMPMARGRSAHYRQNRDPEAGVLTMDQFRERYPRKEQDVDK